MRVVLLFMIGFALCYDVHIFLVMSTYFRCRLLRFGVMSFLCILLINGVAILFWVRTWSIFFRTSVRRSYIEPTSYWGLGFGHVSFSMNLIHSDGEPTGSWQLDFGPPGSWLILGIVILSPLLIVFYHFHVLSCSQSHLYLTFLIKALI